MYYDVTMILGCINSFVFFKICSYSYDLFHLLDMWMDMHAYISVCSSVCNVCVCVYVNAQEHVCVIVIDSLYVSFLSGAISA